MTVANVGANQISQNSAYSALHRLVEEHAGLDAPRLALVSHVSPAAHAADPRVVKHEPAAGIRHQHHRLVVLAVVAHHAAQAVAEEAWLYALVHLAQVHLWRVCECQGAETEGRQCRE